MLGQQPLIIGLETGETFRGAPSDNLRLPERLQTKSFWQLVVATGSASESVDMMKFFGPDGNSGRDALHLGLEFAPFVVITAREGVRAMRSRWHIGR